MTKKRRPSNPKPDGNQMEIRDTLVGWGYEVDNISSLPKLYDLVVSGVKHSPGRVMGCHCAVRVEVKMPGKKLNSNEEIYHSNQRIRNLITIETAEEVDAWFGYDGPAR